MKTMDQFQLNLKDLEELGGGVRKRLKGFRNCFFLLKDVEAYALKKYGSEQGIIDARTQSQQRKEQNKKKRLGTDIIDKSTDS